MSSHLAPDAHRYPQSSSRLSPRATNVPMKYSQTVKVKDD